jgi:predicted DNA-binding protein (UPF0251 family)
MENAENTSQHIEIDPDEIEIRRAVRYRGMPLNRYAEIFGTSRSAAYAAIERGELTMFKLGSRTWLTGESIARRHGLEHFRDA